MQRDVNETRICRPDDLSPEIRRELASSHTHTFTHEGRIYVQLDQTVLCLPDDAAGSELAYAVASRNSSFSRPQSAGEVYQRILTDPDYMPDPGLLREYRIDRDKICRVAVFRSFSPTDRDLYSIIVSMAPVESGDAVIPVDYRTAVFIKDQRDRSAEDSAEFFEAVIGTMESEGIVDIRAGIGSEHSGISGIRTGYREGLRAIQLGMRYHLQDLVYESDRQTLEMIVDSIPDDTKKEIMAKFFGSGSGSGLNAETLETVRVFFRNDLNLTAASKQLFIHRNTLNYRLDKIRKDYGLDLRSFHDAVVFRIITEIAGEQST